GDVWIWNVESGELETKLPVNDSAQVAFSPDNKWLVTGSSSEYRFWKVGSWESAHSIARRGASDHAGVLSFTADGSMLAIAEGRASVRLVDPDTGRDWATLEAPVTSEIARLRFNGNGTQLAAMTKSTQLWDLRLIRHQLAAMKLDWDLPPLPNTTNQSQGPLAVTVLGAANLPNGAESRRHFDRASRYERLGQYENAAQEYEKAMELKPDFTL